MTPSSSANVRLNASSSFLLSNFSIDWDSIGQEIIDEMNNCIFNNRPLSITTYNRLTTIIVEQVRRVTGKIPFKIFSNLASDAVKRYPILLDSDDDGNIIGTGSSSFAEKLRNHNNYLNRFPSKKNQNKSQVEKGKSVAGIREEYYNSGSSECSKNLLLSLKRSTTETITDNLLQSTKEFLRYKLDNTPIDELIAELPIVRNYKFILHHFMAATGCDPSNFNTTYKAKRTKIIKAVNKKRKSKISPSVTDDRVFEAISSALKETFSDMVKEFEVI